jgi:long-chain acyl-CoA synthetase
MSLTFCERVIASCEAHSEKVAMRVVGVETGTITFAETLRQIRSLAYRLEAENIEFGDRIALIGENHPNWAIAYLGTIFRGAVCVPLDPHGEIETITNFLENSEAKLAFLSPDQTEKFQQIEERLGRHIPAVVWNNSDGHNGHNNPKSKIQNPKLNGGFQPFDDWANTSLPIPNPKSQIPNLTDTALLIYTSGTTGTPKGVPLTHGNIVAELDGINDVLKLSENERILSLLPLFHAYLQIVNLWVAVTYGCEVGYLKELTPAELSEAMKQFKPTILTTVPRLWYLFHKKIFDAVAAKPKAVQALFKSMLATNGVLRNAFGINLGKKLFGQVHESFGGNLRLAVSAGSRFDEDVALDFYKLGFNILQGYGLTETSGAATATHETDNKVGSVGKPMKGAEIKIDNPDKDGIGEVLIRGGMVFSGYYKNPTATAEAFTEDGWFRSGDLGQIDKDGHLHIVGRAKDVIVLPSGKNVHPEDLEVHYLKSPFVSEMAIIGVKDESEQRAGAEKLAAVVVPDFEYLKVAKVANSKEAIRYSLDNLGRELPEYQRVRDYIIRAEPLPRTATRKIKRFELKKEVETGKISAGAPEKKAWQLTDEDKALLATPAAKTVLSAIKQNAKDAEVIHPQMNLEIDLGLDSLARAEVFAALEHAFSTEFPAEEATQALTVADVIKLVDKSEPGAVATGSLSDTETAVLPTSLNWSTIVKQADDDFPEIRGVLKNRPIFSAFAFSVYKTFNLFCRIFLRLEVENIEELRKMKRPFLICPNHQSYLDPFVLCSNYPFDFFRNTFHVGAAEFFRGPLMRWLAKLLNVVPINPDMQLMKAMKAGAIGLKHGHILNIYPEGERAFDGELHQFKKGAAILATELDLPILPVAIDGLYKVWGRRSGRIRPGKVKVRFGKAFYAKEVVKSPTITGSDESYEAVTAHLKETIANMIDEMRKDRQ